MTDREYERWIELQDREAAGATLSVAERELCAKLAASHPLCAREDAILNELANLDATPDATSREREDAVLEAFWAEEAQELTAAAEVPVQSAAPARSRTWIKLSLTLVAAAAVALSVGTGIGYLQRTRTAAVEPPASRIELVYSSGDVRIDTRTAAFGQLLAEGSTVEVADGAACLAIDPGIDVCLSSGSTLRVTRTAALDRRVDLLAGAATAAIDPQPAGARFSIVADDVWSTAVGTAFSVSRQAGQTETVVLSGKVLVGPEGKQQIVSAHQRAKVVERKTSVSAMARAEESPYWAAIKTTELWRDPKTAALVIADAGEHASVWLNGAEIGVSPLSSLIPAGEHRLTSVLHDGTTFEHSFLVAAGKTWTLDLGRELQNARDAAAFKERVASTLELTPKPSAVAQPSVAPVSELLTRARQQLRGSEWQAALATYRELRALHPQSAEASTVRVSMARLALEHLSQPAIALAELDGYLTQDGGALSQEARYLRITALRALGRTSVANDAVRAFLDDYPTSFQAETLRRELAGAQAQATSE